jgi:hypothetical protein
MLVSSLEDLGVKAMTNTMRGSSNACQTSSNDGNPWSA